MIELYELEGLFPDVFQEGFSAYKASQAVNNDAKIIDWSVASPNFSSNYFNASTGEYTVPVDGVYAIQATISYNTDSPITTQLGATMDPTFVVQKTDTVISNILVGQFPVFYTQLVILNLRTILANGTVTLSGLIKLLKDDVLELYYYSDGLRIDITIKEVQWAVYRIR